MQALGPLGLRGWCLGTSLLALSAAWSSSAAAQQTAAAPQPTQPSSAATTGQVAEVVVTAQRRSETVQKSSLDIQVLGGEALARQGVTEAADLNKAVPGLQIALVGPTVQVFVRGVGDATTNPLTSPAVAFNIDGVYIGRPESIGSNFFDIARLEVLKGPQGTLYGRNASGGAVNVITNAPALGVTDGYLEGEAGDYSLKRGAGAINLPIGDTVAVRAAFQVVDRDGYLSDGESDESHEEGRIRLLWKPRAGVSLMLNLDGAHQGGVGQGFVLLPLVDPSNPWLAINSPQSNKVITSYPFLPFPATASQGQPSQSDDFYNVSVQADVDLGFATLTVIPAYRQSRDDFNTYGGFFYGQNDHGKQESLETRLSNNTEKLKWVAGLYYYNENLDVASAAATSTLFQNINLKYTTGDVSYAAFGEATYGLTDRLRLIGGLRYTDEHKTLKGFTTDVSPLTGPRVAEVYGPGAADAQSTTWKAGTEFDLARGHLLFFTASTGFKAGGLNPTEAPNTYQPEKLTAYTWGSRNRFFDGRLQVNGEVFYWDYSNKQETSVGETPAGNFTNTTRNAASATLKGGSVDIVARLTHNDTLSFYTEYNDATYGSFVEEIPAFLFSPFQTGCKVGKDQPNNVRLDCSGFQLVRAPKWTGQAGFQHRFDLPGGAELTADLTAQFSSSYYLAPDFTATEHAAAYATGDASLTYRPLGKTWTITGYVKNLNNQAIYTGGTQNPIAAPLFGANINAPRTFGGRVRYTF